MPSLHLAVTGANGLVGRAVIREATRAGHSVTGIVRSEAAARTVAALGGEPRVVSGLSAGALGPAFRGAECLVHLAQIGAERGEDSYEAVNVRGTREALAAAAGAGVGRVVLLSGLGVARYGRAPRVTNAYFLSKLAAEVELYRSGLEAVVFRPSYVVGPGDALLRDLLAQMAAGEVERVGDGGYRMQPIALADAAELVLAGCGRRGPSPLVRDLVGPEPSSFSGLVERLARVAREAGRTVRFRVREISASEAERRAEAGGFHGMGPEELDCLLCDEVGDPAPLEALLGRALTPLDEALARAIGGGR